MTDWPNGGGVGPRPVPNRTVPTTGPGNDPGGGYGYGGQAGYDSGYNTGQVYAGSGYAGGGPAGPSVPGPRGPGYGDARPAPDWGRRLKTGLVTLLVVLLVWSVGTYFWADSKLRREVDLSTVMDRPEKGEGTTYLIVGSDSREGLSDEERKELRTGSAEGKRTDSMIILHVGPEGNTMVSLPRDSWVTIPEFKGSESGKTFPSPGARKLNAAYAMDGATLLVRTVEYNTGLRIDHYAEIGFGGFASIVDALGGVEMDIPRDIKDKNSGADFKKGRQTLDGAQALAFVRNRYEAGSDLERTKNQQKFLSALANQAATPSTVINPFRLYPTLGAGLDTLIVDEDMGLFDLASMFWAMKGVSGGEGTSMNMPIAGSAPQGSLKWDMARVKQLVEQMKNGEKVTVKAD
ncbi:LCP family protein [Streptomyces sp. CNQ085]|uniref:LCP family protein n=1 Tax=Streptomyces sp. CNQ085 TaxID=2886944 RepID=UPI001F510961|nr:LCP family protein [Streptomyces sp. CNQ085]MCI0385484.1 LCP family protein [Streptomyces sp. CNQ085]